MLQRMACGVFFLFVVAPLFGQNSRSAVSVTGNDTAACTVPDPCRTFTAAISKTISNGEVIALTSGGYGPFNVPRAMTILAAPGVYAALYAGIDYGIQVNAGAGGRVVLRNLYIYGTNSGSTPGVIVISGDETAIENCVINGLYLGLNAQANVTVADSTFRNNSNASILISNSITRVKAAVERVLIKGSVGGRGLVAGNAVVTVKDTAAYGATEGFQAISGGSLTLQNAIATGGASGVKAADAGSRVSLSNCILTDNVFGVVIYPPAIVESYGNNAIVANTSANVNGGSLTQATQQ